MPSLGNMQRRKSTTETSDNQKSNFYKSLLNNHNSLEKYESKKIVFDGTSNSECDKKSALLDKEQFLVRKTLIGNYLAWTGVIAKLDPDVVDAQKNFVYAKTPAAEKVISIDVLVYLAYNYSIISYALLTNHMNIRSFMGAMLEQEISLDRDSFTIRKIKRAGMRLKSGESIPRNSGVIDLSKCELTQHDVNTLFTIVQNSYLRYENTKFEKYWNQAMLALTNSDAEIIGFILSNYFYILRALNYNPKFFVTFVDMIQRCEKQFVK